jgi:hypothetical protein
MCDKLSNAVTKFTETHIHISKILKDIQQCKQSPLEVNPAAVNPGDGGCTFQVLFLKENIVINPHVLTLESPAFF